jgi:uncharacterized membrane protein
MENLFFLAILVVSIVCWNRLRDRLDALEWRIGLLERSSQDRPPAAPIAPVAPPPVGAPPVMTAPPPRPIVYTPIPLERLRAADPPPRPAPPAPAAPERPAVAARDWEAIVGGNWLNKLGVFTLVIGIALALGYSFANLGPAGRVAVSLCVSLSMLATGVLLEPRYRVFARGLIGGGWAALYFTVYAMHAVPAARVLENALIASLLLLVVAGGMIVHSLRYRSQTVTGLAYFIGFVTLAISQSNGFAIPALLPLAGSLLYIARRFEWRRFALLGVVGTYLTIALRGDTGAALWQAQALLAIFWLTFEAFDILSRDAALLPFNAAGFLGLSILAWQHHEPGHIWRFAAASSAAYLVSAILRARSAWWPVAATLSAGLAAAAIFMRCDEQWTAFALLVEAEAFYLAGLRLRAKYLRHLGSAIFVVQIVRLIAGDVPNLPPGAWVPVAAFGAAVFYANSFIDRFYSYAGAAMLALIAAFEAPRDDRGLAWTVLAAASFGAGWQWLRADLRLQGYALAVLGILGMAYGPFEPRLSLGLAAAIFYAGALCGRFSSRLDAAEAAPLRLAASAATAGTLASLVWQSCSSTWQGVGWMALGALLLELGVRNLPSDLRRVGMILAALGALVAAFQYSVLLPDHGDWAPRIMPLVASAIAWLIAIRAAEFAPVATAVGSAFLAAAAWSILPAPAVAPAWTLMAAALVWSPRRVRGFDFQRYALAAIAFLRACGPDEPVIGVVLVVVVLHAIRRTWAALAGSLLLAILLYHRVSGSLLTVAWGGEGIALLLAGFPLRDRVLRLSGLAMLLFCILKAFVYDLRYLETLPRIFSFIALGLILVAVSWLYARFRDRLQKLL